MVMQTLTFDKAQFREELEQELTRNILPFWMTKVVDKENGGFYGAVMNDLTVRNEIPRSAVVCARILWTYSTAYRTLKQNDYLATAKWAYDYLTQVFWDKAYGGLYWEIDLNGKPVVDRKHHYAQAFGIYGLSEYYRATREPKSLELAQTLFEFLENHAYEPAYGGYIEGSSRKWEALTDMRLSERDLNCRKSMNTCLHMLEAYTNLLRIWNDPTLKTQHRALLQTFQQHIIDPSTHHFKLFFDDAWNSLSDVVSYGHDIEGSWLLAEAAEVQGDTVLLSQLKTNAVQMTAAVYDEGRDTDGSLFYEGGPQRLVDDSKSWWPQAEALIGFYNAYQISGEARFAEASHRVWNYIQDKLIDKQHGDWFKQLTRDGTPVHSRTKAGPWDCPYHHSRMCFEMMERL